MSVEWQKFASRGDYFWYYFSTVFMSKTYAIKYKYSQVATCMSLQNFNTLIIKPFKLFTLSKLLHNQNDLE